MVEKGFVHIYYGAGKGKTTAALGLILRVISHSQKAALLMFIKNAKNRYGEVRRLKEPPFRGNLFIRCLGSGCKHTERPICNGCGDCHIEPGNADEVDIHAAKEGLRIAETVLRSGEYRLVVLDEILYALSFGLLRLDDVVELIRRRAPSTEVVLTGGGVFEPLLRLADYITEMREIKHHYTKEGASLEALDY